MGYILGGCVIPKEELRRRKYNGKSGHKSHEKSRWAAYEQLSKYRALKR